MDQAELDEQDRFDTRMEREARERSHVSNLETQLKAAIVVIESFRPLVNAAKAFLDYPARPHDCPGFDCATCPPRGEVERAFEGIADMVADADAEAGVSSESKR